jgi:F-type H+-transporting ATPase subunit b
MFSEPEFWVAVAFVILMGVFGYVGVHRTVLKALDNRAARIKAELDEARRLKDEAAKLLAEYKARQAKAEAEAQEIIASARTMPSASPLRPRPSWKISSRGAQDRREQDRTGRSQALADVRRRRQRSGDSGLHHPVAIGQGIGRRRPARQGHRRSSRQAELTDFNS